jgi:hypothetical protein
MKERTLKCSDFSKAVEDNLLTGYQDNLKTKIKY